MLVTVSTVTEAVIDIMRAANPGGIIDQALASRIGGEIRPSLEKVLKSKVGSGAELVALSEFRSILNQHLGSPNTAYVESETRKAMQRTLDTANRTGSEFSSALAQAHKGRSLFSGDVSRDEGGDARRGGDRVSVALARDVPLTVSNAIGFAKELGISPAYAGFFAGGSPEMRDALRNAITTGKAISDDQVKNMKDVGVVLGAIRAGKMSPDDPRIPPSVRGVIEDMMKKGIDPTKADHKTIQKYLQENPKALEAAKQANTQDVAAKAGQSTAKVVTDSRAMDRKLVTTKLKAGAKEKVGGLDV